MTDFGRRTRLIRLFRRDRVLVVPLDHGISDGPIPGFVKLVAEVAANGADAIVVHKGALRRLDPIRDLSVIVHLSGGTGRGPDRDEKRLVTSVAEAVRLGADAVSVHVNVGSRHDARQLADLGAVAGACDRWNVPLLAMMYPRGPKVTDPLHPELVAQAVTIAAELGADIVKTVGMVPGCPIPVVVAGGPAGGDVISRVREAIAAGASGAAVGRAIFQAPDPGAVTRKLSEVIHGHYEGEEA